MPEVDFLSRKDQSY